MDPKKLSPEIPAPPDPAATPAATPRSPGEAGTTEQIDIAQVKSMLDLPATASDIELITVLVNLVAAIQEKYEGLLADAVAMEDNVVNRDMADYVDVIDETSQPFWKEQILQNRTAAIQTLQHLRERFAPPVHTPPEPPADARVIPLRNRLAAIDRTITTVAESAPGTAVRDATAFRIRNRAHEIAKADQVPFIIAFARAENEIRQEK